MEIDETSYGGKCTADNRSRARNGHKSLVVVVVKAIRAIEGQKKGTRWQDCVVGTVRIDVASNAIAKVLGDFIRSNVKAGTKVATDRFSGYHNQLPDYLHAPAVASNRTGSAHLPVVRTLFCNVQTRLTGTPHGVSTKHLACYLREWWYWFNQRKLIGKLDHFILRRAVNQATITFYEYLTMFA